MFTMLNGWNPAGIFESAKPPGTEVFVNVESTTSILPLWKSVA